MPELTFPCVAPGHTKAVVELHYANTPDGTLFLSACLDKEPMLREAPSGDWIGTFKGHKGAVWSAKINRNATLAVSGSADFTAKVWNAATGEDVKTLEHGHVVRSVDFSHSEKILATGGFDKLLRLFTLAALDEKPEVIEHGEKIRKVQWSRDDRFIYTGAEDGCLRVWDVASKALVQQIAVEAGQAVMDLELSASGSTITAVAGKAVAFFSVNTESGTLEQTGKHNLGFLVEAASLHPGHGRTFVCGGSDLAVRVCDVATGKVLESLRGHHGAVHCVRFAPDGQTFSSGADDATIRIWKYNAAAEESA